MAGSAERDPTATDLARAFAHPLRRRLLFEYHRDATSPSRAARRLEAPLNVVSYHTNVLIALRCIREVGRRQVRGALEHFYRATVAPVIDDDAWALLPVKARRAMVRESLAEIASEARRAALAGGFDDAAVHLSRTALDIDAIGVVELNGLLERVLGDALRIQRESAARGPADARPVELVMLQFARASAP